MDPNNLRTKIEAAHWTGMRQDSEIFCVEDPTTLLTWNRFDLAIKLAYLSHRGHVAGVFPLAYKEHIRAFSLGTFTEPGNPGKNSIDRYIEEFDSIYESIKCVGFDKNISLVPLANDGSIVNGAHRVSSAISLGRPVSAVRLSTSPVIYDWNFFYRRGLPIPLLDLAATEFIRHSGNTHIALLWPRSAAIHADMASFFDRVVYDKTVRLNARGMHNLLCTCYRGGSWLGAKEQDFPGIKAKLAETFKFDAELRVIAFQALSLESVLETKERIRAQARCGKSSIHITDSTQESVEIASLLLNDNGIHFLNFSKPNRFRLLTQKLDKIRTFLRDHDISETDAVVDSSLLLELYGIRPANDIDILLSGGSDPHHADEGVQCHDSELVHHRQSKDDLIYDPSFHFFYDGIKFISFSQLYEFKRNRNQEKDTADVAAMSGIMNQSRPLAGYISRIRSKLYFQRARTYARIYAGFIRIAKFFKVYTLLRSIKRLLLGSRP